MSCELYKSEMYAWRAGSDAASFQPLFDHLAICPECARLFEQVNESDKSLQRTFRGFPESPDLEARIFTGLAHQRAQGAARRRIWKSWIFVPVLASLLIAFLWGIRPQLQQARLNRDVAALLSTPPALQIDSTDRNRLLEWSSTEVGGPPTLPSDLSKVEFRGAAAVTLVGHKAVFLKMKNEERASLLIVDAPLTQQNGFHTMREKSGSASLWSDGRRTYVLLFDGSDEEMHAYMTKMGINA
jgi:anti-sigma factor RsiW